MAHLPISDPDVRAHFDVSFLSQVPPALLDTELGKIGAVTLETVASSQSVGLSAVVETKTGTLYTLDIIVDSHGLIRDAVFQPYSPAATSWAQVESDVRSVAPTVGLLVASVSGNSCKSLYTINATTPMPLGSAFKLYVLDALAQSVASGKESWIKPLTVTASDKSLPTGVLQNDPNGTRITTESVAADMISQSDNTASDILTNVLGRSAVEAAVKSSGAADPALDEPFLTTRELFVLKLDDWPTLAKRYLALPANQRLGFLTGTVDKVPLSVLRAGEASWTAPRDVSSIEWFASATDVCHVFAHLASMAGSAKLAPVGAILEANNGGMALSTTQWRSVWFKGGSEPGVLTLNYMATTTTGHSYVVSVLAENPTHSIGPTATGTLIEAIRGAFQLAAH